MASPPPPAQAARAGDDEQVVLLTPDGEPAGTARKGEVHAAPAPYHLAFSCYAFGPDGRLLVTRRARTKRTWPGVWTNTCCGHPGPAETPEHAVARRMRAELGLVPENLVLALPDFSYRVREGDVEENELCPVYLARVDGAPRPEADEVDETAWWTWEEFTLRARENAVSPWSCLQVAALQDAVADYLTG
jgi:isopentenyl-diphosphate Delta-isomerase